jgi:hypothetical protein
MTLHQLRCHLQFAMVKPYCHDTAVISPTLGRLLQSVAFQAVNGRAGRQSARDCNEIWREFQEGQLPANGVICLTRRAPSLTLMFISEKRRQLIQRWRVHRGLDRNETLRMRRKCNINIKLAVSFNTVLRATSHFFENCLSKYYYLVNRFHFYECSNPGYGLRQFPCKHFQRLIRLLGIYAFVTH